MKIYYSESKLTPVSALNALQDAKPIQIINFKCEYQGVNLYSSYVFHPKLEPMSYNDFMGELKDEIPSALISNFQKELELKKAKLVLNDNFNFEIEDQLKESNVFVNKSPNFHYSLNSLASVKESLAVVTDKVKNGFTRFKFKVDQNSLKDFSKFIDFLKVNSNIEFIFDFNGSATLDDLTALKIDYEILKRIYWEDPVEYHFDDWNILKNHGFQLILDQKINISLGRKNKLYPFKIVALKPTKESIPDFINQYPNFQYLITTNMGDELDHRISAFWADEVAKRNPKNFFGAGLYTRHFFKDWKSENHFSDFKESTGWGLDHVMEQKKWTELGEYYFEL